MSGRIDEFQERQCDVLGVSTDSVDTHKRWLTTPPAQGGLGLIRFPLASDTDGTVCKQYGVYVERQRLALRGVFVIDPNGVLQYQVVHNLSVGRSSEEILRVLEALQSGGLCAAERVQGQTTLNALDVLGPNRVIGQYQIETTIGAGAFGTVFRARDTLLDRTVALKVLRVNDSVQTDSLLAEARAAAALNHGNVCTIYGVDTSNGAAMIVMEYVDGQSLAARLQSGPLSHETAAIFGRQIATAMEAAHAAGVIHGDLKPANLMVTSSDTIKVMDFGLARRTLSLNRPMETVELVPPTTSKLSGTPAYMAPEQIQGEPATPASDVFALGLIVYEMLTGRPAVSANTIWDVLRCMELWDPAYYVMDLPEPFADILRLSLARESGDRAITMAEISKRLA